MLWHAGSILCGIGGVLTSGYPGNDENRQGKKTAEPRLLLLNNWHRIDNQQVIS
jgi:hypothetical protein